MPIYVDKRSWLNFAKAYQIGDTVFWGNATVPKIDPSSDDILYVLQENDRIDRLAYRFYGDPRHEWIIKRANNIRLWPLDSPPGTVLRIPKLSRLISERAISTESV